MCHSTRTFLFSVQIREDFLKTQREREERCDIRHLLFFDRREPIRRQVQDQIPAASPLVRRGLRRSRILSAFGWWSRCRDEDYSVVVYLTEFDVHEMLVDHRFP